MEMSQSDLRLEATAIAFDFSKDVNPLITPRGLVGMTNPSMPRGPQCRFEKVNELTAVADGGLDIRGAGYARRDYFAFLIF